VQVGSITHLVYQPPGIRTKRIPALSFSHRPS